MLLRPRCLRRLASRSMSGRSTLGELVSGGLNFEVKRLLAINTILDARHARHSRAISTFTFSHSTLHACHQSCSHSPPHPSLARAHHKSREAHRAWLATQAVLPAGFKTGDTKLTFRPAGMS